MQLAQTAWQYDDVEHYEMNTVRNEVAIGEEVFQLSKDTQYFPRDTALKNGSESGGYPDISRH